VVRGALQEGCATTIREEVEPLEAENAKLRALVQEAMKYARHRHSCPVREWERGPSIAPLTYAPGRYIDACDCGLTALRATAK